MIRATLKAYLLRVAIAIDGFVQACANRGTIGITISARAGTAAAHGHRWGLWMWWLLDRMWPFGRDPVTGKSHCHGAIDNDKLRAQAAIDELNDPVVTAYLKDH